MQPPSRNLPPDSEFWGRWVEGQLQSNDIANTARDQSLSNSLSGLNATLQQLSNQIQILSSQQAILSNQQEELVAIVEFLLGQTSENEQDPGNTNTYTLSSDGDTGVLWWTASSGDASVSVTTSSTGGLRIDVSGFLNVTASGYGEGTGYLSYEVLQGVSQVVAPSSAYGTRLMAGGGGFDGAITGSGDTTTVATYATGHDLVTLTPNTTYTIRIRRGYRTRATASAPGTAFNTASVAAGTTRITVTKIGGV